MAEPMNKLHWTQRIALMRHNLHAASRSGDFTFFKTLQAVSFVEDTNHAAALSTLLWDDADTILSALDSFNTSLAYAHQDAFQVIYENIKINLASDGDDRLKETRSKFFVDAVMQRNLADLAIDKSTSSAINLINQQPLEAQEAVAMVWITGVMIIADSIQVTLQQLESLENKLDDSIRIEEAWNTVGAAVVCTVTGLKGVFGLMDPNLPSSRSSPRSSSIVSASANVFRRLSNAFSPSGNSSRESSISPPFPGPPLSHHFPTQHAGTTSNPPVYRTPNFRGASKTGTTPVTTISFPLVAGNNWTQHKLTTIPPTPAFDDSADPFDTTAAPKVPSLPPVPSGPGQESRDTPSGIALEENAQPTAMMV